MVRCAESAKAILRLLCPTNRENQPKAMASGNLALLPEQTPSMAAFSLDSRTAPHIADNRRIAAPAGSTLAQF